VEDSELYHIENEIADLKHRIYVLELQSQKLLEDKSGLHPGDIIEWGRFDKRTGTQNRQRGRVREIVFWSHKGNPGIIRVNPQNKDGSWGNYIQQVFNSDDWERISADPEGIKINVDHD
jgi:hypothetical protein